MCLGVRQCCDSQGREGHLRLAGSPKKVLSLFATGQVLVATGHFRVIPQEKDWV